ncbi:hypothetical protein RJ641_025684 [Dillenia turbinata]|uniref:Uncharacterized protein n=1 Tax=Dillenia turbinata TaxID=194707 RepID=A0AAN8ZP71_9MAGN
MAATSEEEMESLLSNFDQIYEDFQSGVSEIQLLRSNCNAEAQRCKALEFTCNSLKLENDRLRKVYTESLNKLSNQLEQSTSCQSLKEELKKVNDKCLIKEDEHRKELELLKHEHAATVQNLETQISCLLVQKGANETTINNLHQDLALYKANLKFVNDQLEQLQKNLESKYELEMNDLRDCLLIELEEKKELTKKLQNLERELLISKTKLADRQSNSTSDWHVDALKQKLMKLRKENEILKRKLDGSKEVKDGQQQNNPVSGKEASSTVATKYEIEKFNGNNFSSWKMRIKAILRKDNCLVAIGDRLAEILHNGKWNEMDGNAIANLHLALADGVLSSVAEKKTTKEIWDTLTKLYEAKSLHNKIFLKRRLYTLQMMESTTMIDHINTLNTLFS